MLSSDGDRELESSKVQTLIDALRGLTATTFPSDDPAAQAKYGLTSPAMEATVTPAAEGGKVETVLISALNGPHVYAARKGEATTYEIETAPAAEVRHALTELLKKGEPAEKADQKDEKK